MQITYGSICSKHPDLEGKRNHGHCMQCARDRTAKWLKENSERAAASHKEYFHKNKARLMRANKEWKKKNKARANELALSWYHKNKESSSKVGHLWYVKNKAKKAAYNKKWNADNKDRMRVLCRNNQILRKRLIGGQVISKNYKKELASFYKNCPRGQHVDHIVPIKNAIVCGLHVPWNLQYLPAAENMSKKNKFQAVA